jgi:hypothetical protein
MPSIWFDNKQQAVECAERREGMIAREVEGGPCRYAVGTEEFHRKWLECGRLTENERRLRLNKALMMIAPPGELTELVAAGRALWAELDEFEFEDAQACPAELLRRMRRFRTAQMPFDNVEV